MMDLETICKALKDIGVIEVFLDIKAETPEVEFYGQSPDGDQFRITADNASFSEYGL